MNPLEILGRWCCKLLGHHSCKTDDNMNKDWCLRSQVEVIHLEFFDPLEIERLKQVLIEDIKKLEYQYSHSLAEVNGIEGYLSGFDEAKSYIEIIINERFGYNEKKK